jgi:hypothetical protein
MTASLLEKLKSIESFCKACEKSFPEINKNVGIRLKVVFPEVSADELLPGLLSSWVFLRRSVDELISVMPKHNPEESCQLIRLAIVEIETRVQLLGAHLFRVLSESSASERRALLEAGIKILGEFISDIMKSISEIQLNSGLEKISELDALLPGLFLGFNKFNQEITKFFDKQKIDDIICSRINLQE